MALATMVEVSVDDILDGYDAHDYPDAPAESPCSVEPPVAKSHDGKGEGAPDSIKEIARKAQETLGRFSKQIAKAATKAESVDQIRDLLEALRKELVVAGVVEPYSPTLQNEPPNDPSVLELNGTKILPVGGIAVVIGSPGIGKSAVLNGIASLKCNPESDAFGFALHIPHEKKVIVLDTELGDRTLWENWDRCRRRAGGMTLDGVEFIGLRSQSLSMKKALLDKYLTDASTGLLIVDGVADLCTNVNDPGEAGELIDMLMRMTDKYKVATILSLHDNPGTTTSTVQGKARGHLGSEVCRRADTVLLIKRDPTIKGVNHVTSLFGFGKVRHGANDLDALFQWNDALKMFVGLDRDLIAKQITNRKKELLTKLNSISPMWDRPQLVEQLIILEGISKDAALKRVTRMIKDEELIKVGKKLAVPGTLINEPLEEIERLEGLENLSGTF